MTDRPLTYEQSSSAKFFAIAVLFGIAGGAMMFTFRPAVSSGWQFVLSLLQSVRYIGSIAKYAADAGLQAAAKAAVLQPLGFAGGAIVILVGSGLFVILAVKEHVKPRGQGESAFAEMRHIKRMGLLGATTGKILGSFNGKFLRSPRIGHTLWIAPTRVGKTRQMISSLLTYPGSLIVIDPKGELAGKVRQARAKFGPVHEINWTDPLTADGYNPFSLKTIPADELEREKHAERFASLFVSLEKAEGGGGSSQHFNETAWRNIAAFSLFEIYEALRQGADGHPANVVQRFVEMATAEEENTEDEQPGAFAALEKMQAHAKANHFPARVAEDIGLLKLTHYEERSSHISTLVTKLQLLRSSVVRASLGKSTFSFEDFRRRPTTLFIRYPQSDAKTYGKITALFLESLYAYVLDHPQRPSECSIMLVKEEFRDLPFIANFVNLMTKGAGAGIDINIIVQDLVQLKNIYKEQAKEIRNNCEYLVVYQTTDSETQKELSGLVGQETVKNKSRTAGRDILTSVTTSEQGRFLIRPEQWGIIPIGMHILLQRGHYVRPVLADCVFWDQHKKLRELVPPDQRHAT